MSPQPRQRTRRVRVGNLVLGGGEPVRVQSMTNTATADTRATLAQIRRLAAAGCELVRVAVPDSAAADALPALVKKSLLPLVADIHFDPNLALNAIQAGVAKVRINPGNLGLERSLAVAKAAARAGAAVRIGVNSGSMSEAERAACPSAERLGERMARKALEYAQGFEAAGQRNLVLSVKASDVRTTLAAYRFLARTCDWPLHLGLTEAGGLLAGAVKTAVGIGPLLLEGIGDTVRVSLTGDPVKEIQVANVLLAAAGVRQRGVNLIACPTCGRTAGELEAILRSVEKALAREARPLTVAVMGCVVNGPGEARHADVGLAGAPDGSFMLFARGKSLRRVPGNRAVAALLAEIKKLPA